MFSCPNIGHNNGVIQFPIIFMTPKQSISPADRDKIIDQYLGDADARVYKLSNGDLIFLAKEKEMEGAVVIATKSANGIRPKFATYSAGPDRTILDRENLPHDTGEPADPNPDVALQRLRRAAPLSDAEEAEALLTFLETKNHDVVDLLQTYFRELGAQGDDFSAPPIIFEADESKPELGEPQVFIEADDDEIEEVCKLLLGKQIVLIVNEEQRFKCDVATVSLICQAPDNHISTHSISIAFWPAHDFRQDFMPETFPLALKNSSGQVIKPQIESDGPNLLFTDLTPGQTYTIIKSK
jgi:hypothetical protein